MAWIDTPMVIDALVTRIHELAREHHLRIVERDTTLPWGGWFLLNEGDLDAFAGGFFPGLRLPPRRQRPKMSPKLLVIAPGQRTSWQYHHRRTELWCVVQGPVGVVRSTTDLENELEECVEGDVVRLGLGERHRLVGLADWAVVAEVWVHALRDHPTDEDDIVRVFDDYGRARLDPQSHRPV